MTKFNLEYLKERRLKCRMSQQYVADHLGVSQTSVNFWESGKSKMTSKRWHDLMDLYSSDIRNIPDDEIFIFKNPENTEIICRGLSYSRREQLLVNPWFLSNFLCLIEDGHVSCSSTSYLEISSESNYHKRILIYFDTKICVVMYNPNIPMCWTDKDYFAIQHFATKNGLKFEEWWEDNIKEGEPKQ